MTENRSKPDFLFPSIKDYLDPGFPAEELYMLGAKTTCKDRWRQVLSEAERIPAKHLITLEPGISERQTDEMKARQLQLVVPSSLKESYSKDQSEWLLDLVEFIELVR